MASDYRVDRYITEFYLTTSSSVLLEGLVTGIESGFDESFATMNPRERQGWESLRGNARNLLPGARVGLTFVPEPFCRTYSSAPELITSAIEELLPQLGNPILVSDFRAGYFETDLIERSHRAARWRDRYVIWLDAAGESGLVTVKILRLVFISRQDNFAKKRNGRAPWSIFAQGVSVGHNESWLLMKIGDIVARKSQLENVNATSLTR